MISIQNKIIARNITICLCTMFLFSFIGMTSLLFSRHSNQEALTDEHKDLLKFYYGIKDNSTPNGYFSTHAVVWDAGALDALPEGYVQYYDAVNAERGLVHSLQGSSINPQEDLVPNLELGQTISQDFLHALLPSYVKLITDFKLTTDLIPTFKFDSPIGDLRDAFFEKLAIHKEFESSLAEEDQYKERENNTCNKTIMIKGEDGDLWSLNNFEIINIDNTDPTILKIELSCDNSLINIQFKLGNVKTDPNNLVLPISEFIFNNQEFLDQTIYFFTDDINSTSSLSYPGELRAIYIFPTQYQESDFENTPTTVPPTTITDPEPDKIALAQGIKKLKKVNLQIKKANSKNIKKIIKKAKKALRFITKRPETFDQSHKKAAQKLLKKAKKKARALKNR